MRRQSHSPMRMMGSFMTVRLSLPTKPGAENVTRDLFLKCSFCLIFVINIMQLALTPSLSPARDGPRMGVMLQPL